MSIAILTDTACDIIPEYRQKYNIHILPWWVRVGIQLYEDLPAEELLERVKNGESFESLPPDDHVYDLTYRQLLEQYNEILYVRTSSKYDPTYPSALAAAEAYPGLITVFDSHGTSISLAATAIRASELASQGLSVKEVVRALEDVRPQRQHMFTLPSLKYLRYAGVVGGFQATLGGLMGVNPVMLFKNGAVATVAQPRGYDRALKHIISLVQTYQQANPHSRILFGYAPDSDLYLKQMRDALVTPDVQDYGDHPLGSSVVVSTGPGAISVSVEPA